MINLKMDILYGPLSYLDQAPDQDRFTGCQTFANFKASPPYNMFRPQSQPALKEAEHRVRFSLESAKMSFYKEIKRVIDLGEYRTIYVFHPVDLVSTPEKFSELQEEAKEKDINLISIYHTLKDFKFRTEAEVLELFKVLNTPKASNSLDSLVFSCINKMYVQMIKEYEGLKEVNE